MSQVNDRRSLREAERRQRPGRRRSAIALIIGAMVMLIAIAGVYFAARPLIATLKGGEDYPGPGTGSVMVTVPEGASGTVIASTLVNAGVVQSQDAFIRAARDEPKSSGIQPGAYEMREQMSAQGALEILIDPANRVVTKAVIKEGQRLSEIIPAVAKQSGIPVAELNAAVKDPAAIGLPAQAKGLVEGWLYPATYEISPTTTATELLSQMVQRTTTELTDLGVPQAKWHDTIVEASLVEAERGPDPEDAPKIARVFENRMAKDIPLQLDTTVNYALNRRKVAVSIADTKVKSPYNTYQVKGLPVGAICSPGATAIMAVQNPAEGQWMYFVAVNPDSGETKYAVTEAEFWDLQAELNAWIKDNPGR